MMSRPETAKLIKEAMASPVGSTSRVKARKLFSIMNKLHASHDGMGGPGYMPNMYQPMAQGEEMMSYPQPQPTTPQNLVIFHRIPTPKLHYGPRKQANVADGAGGPGIYDGAGGVFSDASTWLKDGLAKFNSALGTASKVASFVPGSPNFGQNLVPSVNLSPTWSAFKNPATPATPPPAPVVAPGKLPVQTGALSRIGSYISNTVLPTAAKGISAFGNSAAGLIQTAGQNIFQGGLDAYRYLAGYDPNTSKYAGPGYTNFNQTPGGQAASSIYAQWMPTTSAAPRTAAAPAPAPTAGTTTPPLGGVNPTIAGTSTPAGGTAPYGPSVNGNALTGGSPATSGAGSAALNVAKSLGITDTKMSLAQAIRTYGIDGFVNGIIKNEGGSPAGVVNNPGNIKYNGLPGQVNSGVKATDGGTFASYPSEAAGRAAIAGIITNAANGKSAAYGTDPTVESFMNTYTNTGPGAGASIAGSSTPGGSSTSISTKYSNLATGGQEAVADSMGAGMFAMANLFDKNNPVTEGKNIGELQEENRKTIWDKYGIDKLMTKQEALRKEQVALPQDVVDYISARDTYLKDTDRQIAELIDREITHGNMSDPAHAAAVNNQLNALYLQRGRQNQNYIGYLTRATDEHQRALDEVTYDLTNKLKLAEEELKGANAGTVATYNMYASALADMYTAIQDAPTRLVQKQILEQQLLTAQASSVTDPAKLDAQTGYIAQYAKLKGHIIDSNGIVLPGIDLVNEINTMAALDRSILPTNIIQAYADGVNQYLSSEVDTTPNKTGTGVTAEGKVQTAERAIAQFAKLALAGADNANTVVLAQTYANDVATNLAAQIGRSLVSSGKAEAMMEVVGKELAPKGFFGPKQPPTQEQFIKAVTTKTGDPLDASMAAAIYAVFQRFVADGGTPASAVQAFLYPVSSTADRAQPAPYTVDQFAHNLGTVYASNVLTRAFTGQ